MNSQDVDVRVDSVPDDESRYIEMNLMPVESDSLRDDEDDEDESAKTAGETAKMPVKLIRESDEWSADSDPDSPPSPPRPGTYARNCNVQIVP